MDINFIIGAIGAIATIVFGFLSISLIKRRKYPGKITYIKLSVIDLLNNVANNFKEIELLHNNQPIKKNIIYIKGALINNGDIDINSKASVKDISITLPECCKWLDIKPTDYSEGMEVKISIDKEKTASFNFDLFRKDEFIQFEGLIESDNNEISSDIIDKNLKINHRIENTSKIKKEVLKTETEIKKTTKDTIFKSILLLLMVIAIIAVSIFFPPKENVYFMKNNNDSSFYSISQKDNLIVLSPENDGEKVETSFEEFCNNYKAVKINLTIWQKFKKYYWIILIQFVLFCILPLMGFIEIKNAKRFNHIFKRNH